LAAAVIATENWELVLDEPATAVGENGRTAIKTRTVLLAPPGREPSDKTVVCQHARADSRALPSGRVAETALYAEKYINKDPSDGAVLGILH